MSIRDFSRKLVLVGTVALGLSLRSFAADLIDFPVPSEPEHDLVFVFDDQIPGPRRVDPWIRFHMAVYSSGMVTVSSSHTERGVPLEDDPNGGTFTVFMLPGEVEAFAAELLEAGADQFKGVPVLDPCMRNGPFRLTTVTFIHRSIPGRRSGFRRLLSRLLSPFDSLAHTFTYSCARNRETVRIENIIHDFRARVLARRDMANLIVIDEPIFFDLPINSLRYAVSGYDPGTDLCITAIWALRDASDQVRHCDDFGPLFPYVVIAPGEPAGCWSFGTAVELLSVSGCVDWAAFNSPVIPWKGTGSGHTDEVDLELQLTSDVWSGTVRFDGTE